MNFNITPIQNPKLQQALQHKIDRKTKPVGALGILETIALQIGMIQGTAHPTLQQPTLIVFAGDHGISARGEVNPYPKQVTAQMVYNFLQGGAAINVFCKQHDISLHIVDAGVDHDFDPSTTSALIRAKMAYGTHNYQEQPAMSLAQCKAALAKGAEIVTTYQQTSTIIGFGEMGIGNTSSASLLMAYCTGISIQECIGAGTGLTAQGVAQKKQILEAVFQKYTPQSAIEALATFGGFEIAMLVGALLKAAALKMTILIDGFIVTAAVLVAQALDKNILSYCIFTHTSGEQGHQKMLDFLNITPLLNLGMRLGEGTGAAVAFPLVASAVAFLNTMASFEDAGITENEH